MDENSAKFTFRFSQIDFISISSFIDPCCSTISLVSFIINLSLNSIVFKCSPTKKVEEGTPERKIGRAVEEVSTIFNFGFSLSNLLL